MPHVAEVQWATGRIYGHNGPLAMFNPKRWWIWEEHRADGTFVVQRVIKGTPLPSQIEVKGIRVSDGEHPLPNLPLLKTAVIGFEEIDRSGTVKGDVWAAPAAGPLQGPSGLPTSRPRAESD